MVAIPGDTRWRSGAGLEVVGPGAFGYDVPFGLFDRDRQARPSAELASLGRRICEPEWDLLELLRGVDS